MLKASVDDLNQSGWTTTGHDAIDVQVFAYGKAAHNFIGMQDNTDIAKQLIEMILGRTAIKH